MKKRILSLALALCAGLMVPAAASHIQGNNGSDQGGLPMGEGATEIVGRDGYVFTLSQPVIGPISNFEYQDHDGEVMTVEDTYYLLPYGTDISIARTDGGPARFDGVSFPGGSGEAYMEDYSTLTLSLTGPVQLISEGGVLFLYGIEDPPTAGPGTESGFSDVKEGDFFAEPVLWAVDKGITTGTGDGTTFSPKTTCSVSEILTFLWRAKGSPSPTIANPYTAGSADGWFQDAAVWAYENELTADGPFPANDPCTRAMVVTYLWKLAGSPAASGSAFTDVSENSFYAPAVAWAVSEGITTGTGDGSTFSPDKTCTRGEIVTFLYRALA